MGQGTLGKLLKNLPEMLLQQYEYEESAVRSGHVNSFIEFDIYSNDNVTLFDYFSICCTARSSKC